MSTTLFTAYLHWQYLSGPHWLLQLYGNLQRALWQYFSVRFMVRTLLAPWRRDIVSYRGLSLDRMAMALAWNSISRFVGGALRLLIIALWALAEVVLLSMGAIIMVTFIVWPVVVAVGVMTGVVLLIASWQ